MKQLNIYEAKTHLSQRVQAALDGEEVFIARAGKPGVRLVPVPSQVSSDCGVTVRFAAADVARAAELLRQLEDDLQGIFVESNGNWAPHS